MKLIDSHCHLDMEPLAGDYQGAIERATKAGVTGMINVGASMRGSNRSVELANQYPNIWASVGLHPHDSGTLVDLESAIDDLREMAREDKVVAIGEIGLDFFDPETKGDISEELKQGQVELFERQLELAAELNLPVILHIRDAWDEACRMISSHIKALSSVPGVVHCFTGDKDQAQKFLDLGFYVGFTGFVTFEQPKFDSIREAAKQVPMEKILVETDAPFLAPEPYRGKTNEPAYVVEVAKKIAELKKVTLEEVALFSVKNTEKVFNISS